MKGLSIALRVIAILGAAAAAFFWVQTKGKVQEAEAKVTQLTSQKSALQSDLDGVTAEKSLLEGQINSKNLEIDEAKSKVKYANDQLTRIKSDVQRAQKEQQDVQAQLDEKVAEFNKLRTQYLELIENRPPEAPATIADPANMNEKTEEINKLIAQNKELEDKVADLQFKLEAFLKNAPANTTETAADGAPRFTGTQEASILRTDPSKGILIISRGQVDGLQKQMQFNVVKGLERKVSVKVGTVAPTYSVAYILPGEDPSHLQQGDSIKITE